MPDLLQTQKIYPAKLTQCKLPNYMVMWEQVIKHQQHHCHLTNTEKQLNIGEFELNNIGKINRKAYYQHGLPNGDKLIYNGLIK